MIPRSPSLAPRALRAFLICSLLAVSGSAAGTTSAAADLPEPAPFSLSDRHVATFAETSWQLAHTRVDLVDGALSLSALGTDHDDTITLARRDGLLEITHVATPAPSSGSSSSQRSAMRRSERVLAIPMSRVTTEISIDGGQGDDTLLVDFRGGNPVPAGGLTYEGGLQTTADGDLLVIEGGFFARQTYTHVGLDAKGAGTGFDGVIDSDGTIIRFHGLEPITNTGTANDIIFNLPSGSANAATLQNSAAAGSIELNSTGTFENTIFVNPTSSLTINFGNMSDTLNVNALDAAFAASLIVNGGTGNGDQVFLNGVTLDTNDGGRGLWVTEAELVNITGGSITDNTVAGDGAGVRIDNSSNGTLAYLLGVSVTNNAATGTGNGGGVYLGGNTQTTMSGGTISGNTAGAEGGGIWKGGGLMDISDAGGNVLIDGNTASGAGADQGGGGIFNAGGTLNILDDSGNTLTISNNVANGTSGSGGGILNDAGGTLNVTGATISGNRSNRAGGGIEDNSGAGLGVQLTNVTLSNNNTGVAPASASPGNGGGLHVTGAGDVLINGGAVSGNAAAAEGGGLWNGSGTMTIDGTTLDMNTANGDVDPTAGAVADVQGGGGIFNAGGTVQMTANPTLVTNNSATGPSFGSGGAILSVGGSLVVSQATFTANTSTRGGAVETVNGSGTVQGNVFTGTGNTPAALAYDGTNGAESVSVADGSLGTSARGGGSMTFDASGPNAAPDLHVFGHDGEDSFEATALEGTVLRIYGGAPSAPTTPADSLAFTAPADETTDHNPTGPSSGILQTSGSFQDVEYAEIEDLELDLGVRSVLEIPTANVWSLSALALILLAFGIARLRGTLG